MIDKDDRLGAIRPAGTRRLAVIYPQESAENAVLLELTDFEAKILADLLKGMTYNIVGQFMNDAYQGIAAKLSAETEGALGPEGETEVEPEVVEPEVGLGGETEEGMY